MVPGIDSFREKFKDYTDYYTIIGGTACDILLSEADLPFRATKDIDMILIMEDNFPEFASVFWEYIKEGGYKCGWKNEQNMHFYRFTEGKFGYPTMIELFSRKPGYHLEIEEGIIPIHIDDDTSSLSAILLNDDLEIKAGTGELTSENVIVQADKFIQTADAGQRFILRLGIVAVPVISIGAAYILIKRKYIIDERKYEELVAEIKSTNKK